MTIWPVSEGLALVCGGQGLDVFWQLIPHALWVAAFQDTLGSDVQQAWNYFIQSGQVWALAIGFVVGYLFRSFTSY